MSSLYEYFGHQGKGDPGFISLGVKETLGMHFRVSFLRKHMDIYFPFLLLFLCHYSVFGADSRQGSSCSSSGRAEAVEPCEVVKAVKAEDQDSYTSGGLCETSSCARLCVSQSVASPLS